MQPASIPFYLNWTFWTVLVALIAVVLSQIPPIHILLRKTRIDFELYSKISLNHKVGNPNLQLHIIINNVGGRKIRVKDITVSILRDGKPIVILPAQNYLQNQNDKSSLLFTTFRLSPSDEWAHIVNFFNFFNRDDEKKYRALEGEMLADFREKSSKFPEVPKRPIVIENELVTPFHEFFKRHFIWNAGEYLMEVNVITDHEPANKTMRFRFTVFESHTEQLKAITEHFKVGGGIWWDPNILTAVILDISEA